MSCRDYFHRCTRWSARDDTDSITVDDMKNLRTRTQKLGFPDGREPRHFGPRPGKGILV